LGIILLALFVTFQLLSALFNIRTFIPEIWVIYFATVVRINYFLATPFFVKTNDLSGHIQYINYIAQKWRFPSYHYGWETYQPPLFYVLEAFLKCLGNICGFYGEEIYTIWQFSSLSMSIASLGALYWIAFQIYPSYSQKIKRVLFLCVTGFSPVFVFSSGRINNDTLFYLVSLIWLGVVLNVWNKPQRSIGWAWVSLATVIALLTKGNSLILLMVAILALAINDRIKNIEKLKIVLGLSLAVALFSGWFYLPHLYSEGLNPVALVGNSNYLPDRVEQPLRDSLMFDPVEIIKHPFVDFYGDRKSILWENFFKSAFFGQWPLNNSYCWSARMLLLSALLLLPICCYGLFKTLTAGKSIFYRPLVVLLVAGFATQWIYFQCCPFLSCQDFRFSAILVVPVAWFLVEGVSKLPRKSRRFAQGALQFAIMNCVTYIVIIPLFS
jgi:hypothetical protein